MTISTCDFRAVYFPLTNRYSVTRRVARSLPFTPELPAELISGVSASAVGFGS
jgi:hypothetical protein